MYQISLWFSFSKIWSLFIKSPSRMKKIIGRVADDEVTTKAEWFEKK